MFQVFTSHVWRGFGRWTPDGKDRTLSISTDASVHSMALDSRHPSVPRSSVTFCSGLHGTTKHHVRCPDGWLSVSLPGWRKLEGQTRSLFPVVVQHDQSVKTRGGDSDMVPPQNIRENKSNYSENEVKWEVFVISCIKFTHFLKVLMKAKPMDQPAYLG